MTAGDARKRKNPNSSGGARTPDKGMSRLEAIVEKERKNLATAEAILGCLVVTMTEYAHQDNSTPYYPYVVGIALDMVRHSVDQLDSINLY